MSTIKPLPLVQATAPREIWLQVSDEATDSAEQFPSDTEGVTWCADPVLGCEVPYVRADLAQLARRDQADTQAALQREYDHAVEQAARNADEVLALREERDQLRTYFDAAQRRGEELRAELEEWRHTNKVDELERENERLRADAERYRWLALQRVTPEHWGGRWSIVVEGPAPSAWPYKDQFDTAIDAARAAQGEKNG